MKTTNAAAANSSFTATDRRASKNQWGDTLLQNGGFYLTVTTTGERNPYMTLRTNDRQEAEDAMRAARATNDTKGTFYAGDPCVNYAYEAATVLASW